MAQCYGCGRPLGLRGEFECPCWLSYNELTALVPERLQARTKRARILREQQKRGKRR